MEYNELCLIAKNVRWAIEVAVEESLLDKKDKLNYFPRGSCDDACDLLAYYLYERYGLTLERYNGVYCDGNPENTVNHEWLEIKGQVIDITYSQFKSITHDNKDVYFGERNPFYKSLEDIKLVPFFDVYRNERMRRNYCVIVELLENLSDNNNL